MLAQDLYCKSIGFTQDWEAMSLNAQNKWVNWANRTKEASITDSNTTQNQDTYAAQALLRAGFLFNLDITMVLDIDSLGEWGGPLQMTIQNKGQVMILNLEAAFHHHNKVIFNEESMEITLSFDTVYRCTLPYSAFKHIAFGIPQHTENTEDHAA